MDTFHFTSGVLTWPLVGLGIGNRKDDTRMHFSGPLAGRVECDKNVRSYEMIRQVRYMKGPHEM